MSNHVRPHGINGEKQAGGREVKHIRARKAGCKVQRAEIELVRRAEKEKTTQSRCPHAVRNWRGQSRRRP